jgi:ABC-type amino acid transport substrate-binding protein
VGNSHISRFALRRRLIVVALCRLTLGMAVAGFGANTPLKARPLASVLQAGVLRVAIYRDYKPYSWVENGKITGIDADIAVALANNLGVKADLFDLRADDNLDDDLRNGVWKGSIFGAAPGDVMMHVPYDKRIEEKNDRVAVLSPYHTDGLALAVDPAKASQASDFSVFLKEKVAVDVGTLSDIVLISAFDQKLVPNIVHFRGTERAADAFERREVSGFYGEASTVESLSKKGQRPVAIVYPKTHLKQDWEIGMAVRSDSKDLGAKLSEQITKLEDSGEMERIFARYGVNWKKPTAAQ